MSAVGAMALLVALQSAPGVQISPRGGPAGTEVTVRMAGLPPATELVLGFGAPRDGYEWVGQSQTSTSGELDARLRVPSWAQPNRVHYIFVTLPDRPPLGTSPGFHVTAPDGTLRVSGEVVPGGTSDARVIGEFDELYCVGGGRAAALQQGARVTVEGMLGEDGTCDDGIPVQLAGVDRPGVFALWASDRPAFGVYVPEATREGGRTLAENPLYDYLFLNQEQAFDAVAVQDVVAGVADAGEPVPPAVIVRIPPISAVGADATRARMHEVLELGADGIVLPHVRSLDEARQAIAFVQETGASVWSPENPDGDVILMLMLEDPETVAQARAFAELTGYSILACGIGSLRGALGGDQEAAEAGARHVLEEARRRGLADMITATPATIAGRVAEGYLALLLSGGSADEAIRIGREAAGRD